MEGRRVNLTDLIDCPTFHTLAVRACLRRQVEREKPPKKGEQGAPVRPLCASGTCELGRKVWAERPVDVAPCGACGAALFADAACEACATRETETPRMATRQLRSGAYLEVTRGGPVSSRIWNEKLPDPPLVPPSARRGATTPVLASTNVEEERHAPSAGKAGASPDPAPPAVSTTPTDPPRRVPREQVEASLRGVMTDRTCQCGCGRKLRKNNRSGWAGYCNAARYAAGARQPRKSQAKNPQESEMQERKPKPCCGSKGPRHLGTCTGEKKPRAKPTRKAPVPVQAANAVDRDVAALTDDELARIAQATAAEMDRRISTLTAARKALGKAA